MRVETLGDGRPEVAIVGGVHGDEPCGVAAVERLLADPPAVERPVKVVVANERAVEGGVRYVDEDLNRAFPGDHDADTHEGRLAAALTEELDGCVTLALHSTRSHAEPFAVVDGVDDFAHRVVPRLSVVAAVDAEDNVDGRLFVTSGVLEVECGLQGTAAAADNAERLTREFLAAVGALPDPPDPEPVPTFDLGEPIPKAARAADDEAGGNGAADDGAAYEVFVENFERVAAGETFAAVDGEELVAERSFYPVLLSAYGYADIFGYTAERAGSLP